MTAKTSYITEEPWCVLQCAHTDRELSHRAIRRALHSRHPHPIMRKLRGEFRPECGLYLNGADLGSPDVKIWACLIGALRLFPTSERPIEVQHAKIQKRGLGRHCHTEQFMSFGFASSGATGQHQEQFRSLEGHCVVLPSDSECSACLCSSWPQQPPFHLGE